MDNPGEPVGGIDYPRTRAEFEDCFGTEAACRAYLVGVRWPAGFVCPDPACAGRRAWPTTRGLDRCVACGRQVSPTAGTIFAGTRKPLRAWLEVLWQLTSEQGGVSARSLEAASGFGSYQTAWAWLHKLRRAMAEPEGERLSGFVEVGVAWLRRVALEGQAAIAIEVRGAEMGRLRLGHLANVEPGALQDFLVAAVEPGATLRTDVWLDDVRIEDLGYRRDPLSSRTARSRTWLSLPLVADVTDRLEAWCIGTHHGAIRQRQLDAYLAEFAFRFNARQAAPGLAFYRLLERAVRTNPTSFAALVADRRSPARFKGR